MQTTEDCPFGCASVICPNPLLAESIAYTQTILLLIHTQLVLNMNSFCVCKRHICHSSLVSVSVKQNTPNVIKDCAPCAQQQSMERNWPSQPNVLQTSSSGFPPRSPRKCCFDIAMFLVWQNNAMKKELDALPCVQAQKRISNLFSHRCQKPAIKSDSRVKDIFQDTSSWMHVNLWPA